MADTPQKSRRCFVVGPIGDELSDDRIHADWLLEAIIQPVFDEHFGDFNVDRADKISAPGRIDAQVITALLEADLVIADLTTLNPNAFYEIGIRHMVQKPIIHMHLKGEKIPFDIASFRSIPYSRARPGDIRQAKGDLQRAAGEATKSDHVVDNPVTFTRATQKFEQTATSMEKYLQDQIDALQARISNIAQAPAKTERSLLGRKQLEIPIIQGGYKVTVRGDMPETVRENLFSTVAKFTPSFARTHEDLGSVQFWAPKEYMTMEEIRELRKRIISAYPHLDMTVELD